MNHLGIIADEHEKKVEPDAASPDSVRGSWGVFAALSPR